jgi:polar amino acid transport system permease protein
LQHPRSKFSLLDLVLSIALMTATAYIAYRISVGLRYQWNWASIPQFLIRFDAQLERWVPNVLLQGLFTTIRLSIWGTLLATVLGTVAGFWRISDSLFKRLTSRTYVELVRNTPPLVLIFIFYFFISDQIFPALGIDAFVRGLSPGTQHWVGILLAPPAQLVPFLSALLTLALFEGAYIAEMVRAGIQSIEKGQWEAAAALGFGWWPMMRDVIIPQAVPRMLPPLGGQFISTIKDSAIVSVISIQELTFQGMELMAATYFTFEIWITITLLYLMLTLTCSLAVTRLEMRLRRVSS